MIANQLDQRAAGRAAVLVANHKIRMHFARKLGGLAGGDGGHRVAIEVNAVAVPRVGRIDRFGHSGMIGLPAVGNARTNLGNAQRTPVNRHTLVGGTPNQTFAQAQFFQRANVGRHRIGPRLVKQAHVDVGDVAIGIQIAARKQRFNPRCTQGGRKVVQLLNMRVFSSPQHCSLGSMVKIDRVVHAAVGRIQHQRCAAGHAQKRRLCC